MKHPSSGSQAKNKQKTIGCFIATVKSFFALRNEEVPFKSISVDFAKDFESGPCTKLLSLSFNSHMALDWYITESTQVSWDPKEV